MQKSERTEEEMRVKSYTVHEPDNPPADVLERANGVVFVKDGFAWLAAAFPPIWCIANSVWLVFLGYLIAVGLISLATAYLPGGAAWGGLAAFAFNLIFAFEANNLKRWTLARKGYRMIGTVSGYNELDCERRFFDGWLDAPDGGRSEELAAPAPSQGATQITAARGSIFGTPAAGGSVPPVPGQR